MTSSGWIGVDLDGTLAHYEGWKGEEHIGEPVPAMIDRVKGWLASGWEVRVFTARMSDPDEAAQAAVRKAVASWTANHIGFPLRATCMKDYAMIELWDDRCVAVEANTGRPLNESTRGL